MTQRHIGVLFKDIQNVQKTSRNKLEPPETLKIFFKIV